MLSLPKKLLYTVTLGLLMTSAIAFSGASFVNTIRPAGIVIHHSAIRLLPDGRTIDAKLIDEIHRERGYGAFYWGHIYHIGYHYIILPDGTVQQGRPEHCEGAHTAGYNSFIGICLVGDFSSADNPNGERGPTDPTKAQMRSLTELCRNLRQKYQFPLTAVVRHSDVNPNTVCPGERFPLEALLKTLQQ
jgi:N-acetylmuramoyl-L-alanine amidase